MENDETDLAHSQTQCALCDMAMKGSLVIMKVEAAAAAAGAAVFMGGVFSWRNRCDSVSGCAHFIGDMIWCV
jgi:hypothetical protein